MAHDAAKDDLKGYLQSSRDALLWKLDDLSEYDQRRPLVPTGTNLLGLVKHVASVEAGYLGDVFDRPYPEPIPWLDDDAEDNADMWATLDETPDDISAFYRRVWVHSDATIDDLDLTAIGTVPWWSPGKRQVTLQRIIVHMIAETSRHAGHADIVRELIDGRVGLRAGNENVPTTNPSWWTSYHGILEQTALAAEASDREG